MCSAKAGGCAVGGESLLFARGAVLTNNLADDLAAVARIDVVPTILEMVCRTSGLRFAAVARVTEERWIACAVRDEIAFGLQPGGELRIETTICNEIRDSGQAVVIDRVADDEIFCRHPTPKMYGFQSYISVPITLPDGQFFGTLCGLDPRPARLNTPETMGTFKLFAELIGFHLAAQHCLRASETALATERRSAELREQFIAVLGHDLRNPLTAIDGGAQLLLNMPLGDRAKRVAALIQNSAWRMAGLVDNVLDFAGARLGGGIGVDRAVDPRLAARLEHVVAELRTAWSDRVIESEISVRRPVACDSARIAQLLSNLLANALTHGDPAGPVRVRARSDESGFELSVANRGEPIPPDTVDRLFQPFERASPRPGQQGLGLGLYIASEIARAHDSSLQVASSPQETRFTFRIKMPAG
jgi:K+-sensing histidine kinase KdpD